jgi:hypothetical protein
MPGANYRQHYSMKAQRRKVGNCIARRYLNVGSMALDSSPRPLYMEACYAHFENLVRGISAVALRGRRQGWIATPAPPTMGLAPWNPKLM